MTNPSIPSPQHSQDIQVLLNKIIQSQAFINSPRHTHLLEFLVQKALQGEYLKEYTIGVECFKKDYKGDGSDSVVRVNMHHLRKKLADYYQHEGQNDPFHFTFKNRSYNLEFEAQIVAQETVSSPHYPWMKIGAITLLIIGLGITYYTFSFIPRSLYTKYFWAPFLNPEIPTKCILADHLLIGTQIGGVGVAVNHPDFVTKQDFTRQAALLKKDSIHLKNFVFFTKSIPYAIQKLERLYCNHEHEFTQLSEIDFHYSLAKEANLIYVGQLKTMKKSSLLFLKDSKHLSYQNQSFYATQPNGQQRKYTPHLSKDGLQTDYAIVSYMPLNDHHSGLYFVSDNDMGIMATIDHFLDPEFLKEFYAQLKHQESYFNALCRIQGADRTDMSCEVIALEEICSSSYYFW